MRSLYLKVFLAFWLVMLLVIGSNMMVTWLLAKQFQNSQSHNEQVATYAEQTLQRYLDQGSDSLNDWYRQLHQQTGLRVLLLDQRARSLNGEPLPPRLHNRLHNRSQRLAPNRDTDHQRLISPSDRFDSPPHRSMMAPSFRPIIWPIEYQQRHYLFVVLNPHELIDHLYSGAALVWRLGLSILLVGLLSFVMARYLIRPIRQLQRTSQQLAQGQLDSRVGQQVSSRKDELGQLGQDFDRMAERLQTLLQGQQQLLRDVSHELRTPLARQRVALELARKKPGSMQALDRVEHQAELLDELIGEILLLARLDSQPEQDSKHDTNLNRLLQTLTDDCNFDHSRVRLEADQPVVLKIDPKLINRALDNVIGNALKYSQAEVSIQLEHDENEVMIRVRDQGPGIEPSMLNKIFEPFVRTDQARSRQQGGWGLGLAIAARAIKQHQGDISATNLDPHGLEVTIRLPRA